MITSSPATVFTVKTGAEISSSILAGVALALLPAPSSALTTISNVPSASDVTSTFVKTQSPLLSALTVNTSGDGPPSSMVTVTTLSGSAVPTRSTITASVPFIWLSMATGSVKVGAVMAPSTSTTSSGDDALTFPAVSTNV